MEGDSTPDRGIDRRSRSRPRVRRDIECSSRSFPRSQGCVVRPSVHASISSVCESIVSWKVSMGGEGPPRPSGKRTSHLRRIARRLRRLEGVTERRTADDRPHVHLLRRWDRIRGRRRALQHLGSMVRLDADPFLDQLAQMIVRNKSAGSVVVTMKRCAWLASGDCDAWTENGRTCS